MSYIEQINDVKQDIKNKNFFDAQTKLENMLKNVKVKNVEDENNIYCTFNNYIEELLFFTMYKTNNKKLINININVSEVYYYLGLINMELKNYGKALEDFDKGLDWNPIDISLRLQKVAAFRMLNNLERFRAEVEKSYKYIYNSYFMARYYNELGWYYTEREVYDLANALYSYSLNFRTTEVANKELKYIAQQEDRKVRKSTKEEINKLFKDYNIPLNFCNSTFQIINQDFQRLIKQNTNSDVVKFMAKVLYDMSLNKKYLKYAEDSEDKPEDNSENKIENKTEKFEEQKQEKNQNINVNAKLNKIIEEYNKNGINQNLTTLLNEFSTNVIKEDGGEPFWSDAAKNMLETIILLNIANSDVNTEILLEQSKDINKARQICRENVNKLDIAKLQEEGNFIDSIKNLNRNDNDRTLASILNIIYKSLIQYDKPVTHKENIKVTEIKPIIVKCPTCGNEFELNWNVPADEKVFYCKCPNCNAEIKQLNPHYKG